MFERALNAFWILLGAATAVYAWSLGLVGPAGPESGLFPFIAAIIIMGAGIILFVQSAAAPSTFAFPRGVALGRVVGVIAGLTVMALGMPYLGFAITGAITMMILLRTVESTGWVGSIALSVASVVIIVWLFGQVLGMALPRGPWGW